MPAGQVLTTDHFGHWIETVCRTYVDLNVKRLDDGPFHGAIDMSPLGETVFADLRATAQHADRRAEDIPRASGEYAILILQQTGASVVSQDGRDARLRPGDAVVVDTVRPYTLHLPEPVNQLVLHCPRHHLRSRLRSLRAVTAARIDGTSPTGALLAGSLRSLARQRTLLDGDAAAAVGRYTLDLLAVALEATGAAAGPVSGHSAAALRARIDAWLHDNLADPDLTPDAIARAHGISLRHLHRLFHQTGETVGGVIRAGRLDRCRADLADSRQAARSITEIALRWGFGDSAHFSRAFKARFGLSPRDCRRHARD